jgi:hypothetical protein
VDRERRGRRAALVGSAPGGGRRSHPGLLRGRRRVRSDRPAGAAPVLPLPAEFPEHDTVPELRPAQRPGGLRPAPCAARLPGPGSAAAGGRGTVRGPGDGPDREAADGAVGGGPARLRGPGAGLGPDPQGAPDLGAACRPRRAGRRAADAARGVDRARELPPALHRGARRQVRHPARRGPGPAGGLPRRAAPVPRLLQPRDQGRHPGPPVLAVRPGRRTRAGHAAPGPGDDHGVAGAAGGHRGRPAPHRRAAPAGTSRRSRCRSATTRTRNSTASRCRTCSPAGSVPARKSCPTTTSGPSSSRPRTPRGSPTPAGPSPSPRTTSAACSPPRWSAPASPCTSPPPSSGTSTWRPPAATQPSSPTRSSAATRNSSSAAAPSATPPSTETSHRENGPSSRSTSSSAASN